MSDFKKYRLSALLYTTTKRSNFLIAVLASIIFSTVTLAQQKTIYEDANYTMSVRSALCLRTGAEVIIKNKHPSNHERAIPDNMLALAIQIAEQECGNVELGIAVIPDQKYSIIRPDWNVNRGYNSDSGYYIRNEYDKMDQTPLYHTALAEFSSIISKYAKLKNFKAVDLLTALEDKYVELISVGKSYGLAYSKQYRRNYYKWFAAPLQEPRRAILELAINKLQALKSVNLDEVIGNLSMPNKLGDTYRQLNTFVTDYPQVLRWLPRNEGLRLQNVLEQKTSKMFYTELMKGFDSSIEGLIEINEYVYSQPVPESVRTSNGKRIYSYMDLLKNAFDDKVGRYPFNIASYHELEKAANEAISSKEDDVIKKYYNLLSTSSNPVHKLSAIRKASRITLLSSQKKAQFLQNLSEHKKSAISHIYRNEQTWLKNFLTPGKTFKKNISQASIALFGTDIRNAEFGEYPFPLDQIRDTIVRINWNASKTNQTHPVVAKVPQTKPNASLVDHFLKQSKMYQVTLKGVSEINITKVDDRSGKISYRTKFILGNGPFKGKEHLLVGHTIGQLSTDTANVREYAVGFSKKQCSITHLQSIGLESNSYIETAPDWLVEEYDNLLLNKVWAQKSRDVGKMNCVSYQLPTRHSCPKFCNKKMETLQEPSFLTTTKAEALRLNNFLATQGLSLTEKGALEATMYQNHLDEMQRQHDLWVQQQNDNEAQFQTILMILGW